MDGLWRETKQAARRLSRERVFTSIALITLAVALGANTAVFSILESVLLRPLPYDSPERLVAVWEAHPQRGIDRFVIAPATLGDYREQSTVFEELAAFEGTAFDLSSSGRPERIRGLRVTPSLFPLLEVPAQRGRVFTDEDIARDERLAVVSHQLWTSRFGRDPGIVGKTIRLNGESYRVQAVMPEGFRFPPPLTMAGRTYSIPAEIWTPIPPDHDPSRTRHSWIGVARLKEGVSLERANTEMETIASRLAADYPDEEGGSKLALYPLAGEAVQHLELLLYVLLAAVVLVLLISCANLANLVSARAASRSNELAVRSALGARPRHLSRQIVLEGLLLSFAGGALGALLAAGAAPWLAAASPQDLSFFAEPSLNLAVLGFTLALCVLSTLIFSAWPAIRVYRADLARHLQTSRNGAGSRSTGRSALVVAEVALAVVLVAATALLVRSLDNLLAVDLGFDPAGVLTGQLILTAPEYADPETRARFARRLQRSLEQIPGAVAAGVVDKMPLTGARGRLGIEVQEKPSTREEPVVVDFRVVSWGYFDALRIPLLQGEIPASDGQGARQVAVNRSLSESLWPAGNAVGKRLRWKDGQDWFTVSAVVEDVRAFRVADAPAPALYVPIEAQPPLVANLVLRHRTPRTDAVAGLREAVARLDANLPLAKLQGMDEVVLSSLSLPRFSAAVLSGFGVVALLLAAVGIYGLVAGWVARRRQEIGIRMALGAHPRGIRRLILGGGLKLGLLGAALGVVASLWLGGYLSTLLFEVRATDPLTLAGVCAFMLAVTAAACLGPAWRAARVDPARVLRPE